MFAGHWIVGTEQAVVKSRNHANLLAPGDGVSIELVLVNIGECALCAGAGFALEAVEHGDDHAARGGFEGAERIVISAE